MSALHVQPRLRDDRARYQTPVRLQLDARLPARAVRRTRQSRSATSATAATTCGALYNLNETNIIENGFLQEFRNAQQQPRDQRWPTAARASPTTDCPARSRCRSSTTAFGPRGSIPAVPAASGLHQPDVHHTAAAGAGGTAGQHARRHGSIVSLRDGRQRAARMRGAAATTPPGPYPINFFQANPFAAGNAVRLPDRREPRRKYDALQLQFRQRYHDGPDADGELHVRQGAHRSLPGVSADDTGDYITLRDKSLNWGPTGVRPAAQLPDLLAPTSCRSARAARSTIDNAVMDQAFGGWAASGIVRDADRPAVPADERPADVQPAGRGRHPQRHHGEGAAEDGERQARPNGNVFFFDPTADRPRRPREPAVHRAADHARRAGQYVYCTVLACGLPTRAWPSGSRLGGGTSVQLRDAVHQRVQPSQHDGRRHGGATFSIDSTTFGQATGTAIGARQVQFRLGFNW